MASNSDMNDKDQHREEEEESMSMVDVLQEEKQLEEDADAILGGSDCNQCTYAQGYVQRQALYACATCTKDDMDPAGVCLACSLECHEGHTLYELYTKRNFCCDCGNQKFGEKKCKLNPDKSPQNEKNRYSQNFRGLYCTCHRPYPDPEDSIEDEMIQCHMCEDWLHSRHLGGEIPEVDYDEMICDSCMARCTFLYTYTQFFPQLYKSTVTKVTNAETTEAVTITAESSDKAVEKPEQLESVSNVSAIDVNKKEDSQISLSDVKSKADNRSSETENLTTIPKPGESKESGQSSQPSQSCVLEEAIRQKATNQISKGPTFWLDGWRTKLCSCPQCKAMYEDLDVAFLPDLNDTLRVYTAKGKDKRPSRYEKGMQALQNMDRMKQVEVLTEFNTMKDALTDYLKKFAENKKTVRKEDIEAFYENLRANKRPRLAMQDFCR